MSGEVELDEGEIGAVRYRRKDVETLLARIDLKGVGLRVVYVWTCPGAAEYGLESEGECEQQGGGWRVEDLLAIGKTGNIGEYDEKEWVGSIAEADEAFARLKDDGAAVVAGDAARSNKDNGDDNVGGDDDGDNDDAYWAAYDQTPGPTPTRTSPPPLGRLGTGTGTRMRSNTAIYTNPTNNTNSDVNHVAQPNPNSAQHESGNLNDAANTSAKSPSNKSLADSRNISASELAYFARYESEVQPAMDGPEPDSNLGSGTERSRAGDGPMRDMKGLRGLMTIPQRREMVDGVSGIGFGIGNAASDANPVNHPPLPNTYQSDINNNSNNNNLHYDNSDTIDFRNTIRDTNHQPLPLSASIAAGTELARTLESYAALASHQSRVETAVRQHISAQVKSMYRLAGSVGIGREEFASLVGTEVELLGVGEE